YHPVAGRLNMKISEQSKALAQADKIALPQTRAGNVTARQKLSLSAAMASAFGKFDIALRARLLGRLLASVGPLALKVVGDGVFAKCVRVARSPEIPFSLDDAARSTTGLVSEPERLVPRRLPE